MLICNAIRRVEQNCDSCPRMETQTDRHTRWFQKRAMQLAKKCDQVSWLVVTESWLTFFLDCKNGIFSLKSLIKLAYHGQLLWNFTDACKLYHRSGKSEKCYDSRWPCLAYHVFYMGLLMVSQILDFSIFVHSVSD